MKANLIGGATISFGYLKEYLDQTGVPYVLVNTQKKPTGKARIFNHVYTLLKTLSHVATVDVIFLNSSRGGTKYLAPILYGLAKLFRIKFVFRPFGGDIQKYTDKYAAWQKWIFRNTTLRADIVFLQTKASMKYFSSQNANTIQLVTSRANPPAQLLRKNRSYARKFVYLGFVNQAKGIDQIIEAAQQLDDSYTIHIYGPIKETIYHQKLKTIPGLYQGVVPKDKVLQTLSNYDVLLLPTFYGGEGYPGAIIEAYSLGLPVIATRWNAIPEIVKERETGLLIEPKSTEALIEAINYFNERNYNDFANNARQHFESTFKTDEVLQKAMNGIKQLFKNEQNPVSEEASKITKTN